jgi:hypothetical protein
MNWDEQPGIDSKELRRSFSTAEHYGFHSLAKRICGCQWDTHGCPQNPLMKIIAISHHGNFGSTFFRENHEATAPLRLNFGFNSCSKTSEIRLQLLEPEYSSWLIRKRGVQLPGFGDFFFGKLRNPLEFAHQTYCICKFQGRYPLVN